MQYHLLRLSVKTICICLCLTVISTLSSAQNTYKFTEGLTVDIPYSYGREAIYTDELL